MKILISGAGVAGPAFVHALSGRGFDVTVVERAPALRDGGQAVDFRGPVHRAVLDRLGLWEPIFERRTAPGDLVLIGRGGRRIAALPSVMISGDVEIVRGRLVRLLYDLTARSADYRFGDEVTRLEPRGDGVRATLRSGAAGTYDLVIGADGLHSRVRSLAFGDEARFLTHHGYRLATFGMRERLDLGDATLLYTEPGRGLMLGTDGAGGARALFVFAGAPLPRGDVERQRALVQEAYRGAGWEVPRVLAELPGARDLYVDDIATIRADRWSSGRVALLGDAAWGGTLGGQGTPMAIVGAYVLAGELTSAPRDIESALARFESRMRPYALDCQKGAARAGSFFAPRTRIGVSFRNMMYRALTSRLLLPQFEKLVKASAGAFELPEYPSLGEKGGAREAISLSASPGPDGRASTTRRHGERAIDGAATGEAAP